MFMFVAIAAVIALLLFIYVNRSINNSKANRREMMIERREEVMEQFLASRRKSGTETADHPAGEQDAE